MALGAKAICGFHMTGRIYDRIRTSSWVARLPLDVGGGSIYVANFQG